MADAPTEQAIAISTGIVDALHAAGVLQGRAAQSTFAASAGSEGQAIALSTAIVNALSVAGVLQAQGTPTTPPAPELEVGDFRSFTVRVLTKSLTSNPDTVKVQLDSYEATPFTYVAELTPHDAEVYLPEVHRLQTIERPIGVSAYVKITGKITATKYDCELRALHATSGYR